MACFKSEKTKLSVAMAYAPTEGSDASAKDQFYFQLQSLLDHIPLSHISVLLGNMNAKVGLRLAGDSDSVG